MRWGLLGLLVMATPAAAGDISLRLPVACEMGRTCFIQHYVDHVGSAEIGDYRCGTLTYDGHDGTDFRLPTMAAQKAEIDVLAAADGTVLRLRDGVEDVSVAERGREGVAKTECGNGAVIDHGEGWETQYCHLAKGSLAVRPGEPVKAGDRIGRVGLSGLTEFPHLHFTVRRDGEVVDPFVVGPPSKSCAKRGGLSYWEPSAHQVLVYQPGSVLNTGFAPAPVTMEAIEAGEIQSPTARSPALVAYIRAIGLRGGDRQTLTLLDPDGEVLARNEAPPLDRNKAQWMMFSGVKRPEGGFRPGAYTARYTLTRDGETTIEQAFTIDLAE